MRWTAKESLLFFQSKEYIDTALIPLIPLELAGDGQRSGNANEFIQLISTQLEKQFKGRILLLPSLAYFTSSSKELKINVLKEWINELKKAEFKHCFFISSDMEMKEAAEKESCEFIWLPSVPLEHMDDSYQMKIIEDQVKQLLNIFVSKWQEAEKNN